MPSAPTLEQRRNIVILALFGKRGSTYPPLYLLAEQYGYTIVAVKHKEETGIKTMQGTNVMSMGDRMWNLSYNSWYDIVVAGAPAPDLIFEASARAVLQQSIEFEFEYL